jgi:hypothetical protein
LNLVLYDNPQHDLDSFVSNPIAFIDLSQEWNIVDITTNQVRLRGVTSDNKQNGTFDLLKEFSLF